MSLRCRCSAMLTICVLYWGSARQLVPGCLAPLIEPFNSEEARASAVKRQKPRCVHGGSLYCHRLAVSRAFDKCSAPAGSLRASQVMT